MRHKIVLSSFIFALFSAAPAAAQNECGAQSDPGNPETIDCAPGDYNNGITYSSDGDLTLQVPDDSVDLDVDDQGIAVTGNGGDNIAWDSSDFTSGSVAGNAGALIDYHSAAGDIDIRTGTLDTGDFMDHVTHVIRAESSGGGDIYIEHNEVTFTADTGIEALTDGDIEIVVNGRMANMDTGVRAISGGGDIDLTVNDRIDDPVILDTSAGAGALTVDLNAGLADELQATSGSGPMTINFGADADFVSDGALTTVSGGDTEINLMAGSGFEVYSGTAKIDMTAAAGTVTTVNNATRLNTARVRGLATESLVLGGAGAGEFVVDNTGGIFGNIDFSASDGGVTFQNNRAPDGAPTEAGGWSLLGTSRFSAGNDTLDNDTLVLLGPDDNYSSTLDEFPDVVEGTIDFGAGDQDSFDNAGVLAAGSAIFRPPSATAVSVNSDPQAFTLTLQDLETFDNSGTIVLGTWAQREPRAVTAGEEPICFEPGVSCAEEELGDTDGEFSDVLSMPDTAYTGNDGRILLDAVFSLGAPQTGCRTRGSREDNFRLPGADCVDLRNGSTAGGTQVVVRDFFPNDIGAHNPAGIVVVDVGGGESAAGHFTLSPESDGYDAVQGGIDKGLFTYSLAYDRANQQHKLVGLPGKRAFRMPLLVQAAQATARVATDSWFDRRRQSREGGDGDGTWARLNHASAERDAAQSLSAYNNSVSAGFDNDYDQDTTALTLGRDLVFGGGDWMLGGSLGYTRTRLAFDDTATRSDFDGVNVGVHGSYSAGPLFADAMIHGAWLEVDYNDPVFSDPSESNNARRADAETLSARAEAGWRLELGERLRLEPLAGLSWVRAEFGRMRFTSEDSVGRPDNSVFGGNASTSLRGGVGARLRFDQPLAGLRLDYGLTGRVWEEFDGETDVRIQSTGPDATVRDEFDGTFGEVRGRIGLSNRSGSVSGYLSADGTFSDDYDSLGAELGFRYQW